MAHLPHPLSLYLLKADSLPSSLTDTLSHICIPCSTYISNTLTYRHTTFSVWHHQLYISLSLSNTHMHAHTHVYTRWCVCFCSVIFQWGVFGGWFWSGWCFCLKTSNWVIAGNRRRRSSSSKPGKANSGWVREELYFAFSYMFFSV